MSEWIGKPLRRKEDARFVTGAGNYVADVADKLSGIVCLHIVRSPHACAEIGAIRIDRALQQPGVLDIFTGKELSAAGIGGLPCAWPVNSRDGTPMAAPEHPVLVTGRALHVGDPVVAVVAKTAEAAEAAAEMIEIDYSVLPSQTDLATCLKPQAPVVHSGLSNNQCFDWELGNEARIADLLQSAPHVVELDLVQNRVNASPMETRGTVGIYDRGRDHYTLYTSNQNPHPIRVMLSASTLKVPEEKIRVISPDVGGGFGMKIYHYNEEVLVLIASKRTGRPVRWIASRSEAFLVDTYARDHVTKVALGLDGDGRFLALKVETIANMGAYLSTFAPAIPTFFYGNPLPGPYALRDVYVHVRGAFTNTTSVDAYRGAGRPEATYVLERIVECAAEKLGMDPFEIRQKNLITPPQIPYETPFLWTYDSGDLPRVLNSCQEAADLPGIAERKQQSRARGRARGLGIAFYMEACGMGPSEMLIEQGCGGGQYEVSTVRVSPTGGITVLTGSHSHGQGHETAFAQLVAEETGLDPSLIEIVHGDTDKVPYGIGTYGSRSLAVGGSAILGSTRKVVAKMKRIAARMLDAEPSEVDLEDGIFKARPTNRTATFVEVAGRAYAPVNFPEDLEPGLEEVTYYDPEAFTFPYGCHLVELEVDRDTGRVFIERYLAIDDFGRVVNPMIVEGQIHGGAAQAIGQACMEECRYDKETGQLLTGSFMDYAMPRASDLPAVEFHSFETICSTNPVGAKGCGEAAAIAGPAATINAICNALQSDGVRHIDMPATPEKVWRAINKV
ncbi:xanthine dehydrogenase family protein molybdopterin-binding subunit [Pelagibius sp. Alg239-R121]|uniref:xanthine dehydrogenase family protein molybdopterin-binding subunit n=1 Tax=Pelagibius sp. Alg239-R121 TaxID=2993448 RepID=UPI0024A7A34E|nr:xanthine dehydrogenase family protein molybdopterin-binding subunit [Pelagibius sp. Alg239-R121]